MKTSRTRETENEQSRLNHNQLNNPLLEDREIGIALKTKMKTRGSRKMETANEKNSTEIKADGNAFNSITELKTPTGQQEGGKTRVLTRTGFYYCANCQTNHRHNSNIGTEHEHYAESQAVRKLKAVTTERAVRYALKTAKHKKGKMPTEQQIKEQIEKINAKCYLKNPFNVVSKNHKGKATIEAQITDEAKQIYNRAVKQLYADDKKYFALIEQMRNEYYKPTTSRINALIEERQAVEHKLKTLNGEIAQQKKAQMPTTKKQKAESKRLKAQMRKVEERLTATRGKYYNSKKAITQILRQIKSIPKRSKDKLTAEAKEINDRYNKDDDISDDFATTGDLYEYAVKRGTEYRKNAYFVERVKELESQYLQARKVTTGTQKQANKDIKQNKRLLIVRQLLNSNHRQHQALKPKVATIKAVMREYSRIIDDSNDESQKRQYEAKKDAYEKENADILRKWNALNSIHAEITADTHRIRKGIRKQAERRATDKGKVLSSLNELFKQHELNLLDKRAKREIGYKAVVELETLNNSNGKGINKDTIVLTTISRTDKPQQPATERLLLSVKEYRYLKGRITAIKRRMRHKGRNNGIVEDTAKTISRTLFYKPIRIEEIQALTRHFIGRELGEDNAYTILKAESRTAKATPHTNIRGRGGSQSGYMPTLKYGFAYENTPQNAQKPSSYNALFKPQ